MYLDYLKERYAPGDLEFPIEKVAEKFEQIKALENAQIFKTERGFITYRMQGDAAILFDIYVKPEHRMSGEGRRMFDAFTQVARKQGKRVMITFSDKAGNRKDGLAVMKLENFVKYSELKNSEAFIKGI